MKFIESWLCIPSPVPAFARPPTSCCKYIGYGCLLARSRLDADPLVRLLPVLGFENVT